MFSYRIALVSAFVATYSLISDGLQAADISSTGSNRPKELKAHPRTPEPVVEAANDGPSKAMKGFKVPKGFDVRLWAAEPLLSNPVAFCFDDKGRLFTSETNRYRSSTLDIREYLFMLEDDLANRSTDDRIASIKKNFPKDWQSLARQTEVIRLVTDTDDDGRADKSVAYADGFNTMLDGVASGVLAYDGNVWFTDLPNVWLLRGEKPDGSAESRKSLSFGYGVRFSLTGHDLHGLIIGPDGRLYFSFGDRGAHVTTPEGKVLDFPDEGAVFRCELDGSHLEPVMRGLRNPQELAFDDHGNLFTGDNDSDQGDRERWVYVVEGGDAGWRVGWQHNPQSTDRNPWLAEAMWEPRDPKKGQPAYILSPIVNLPDGPSGLAYYPGTGFPAEFQENFFVCSFKGSSARSSVARLRVKQKGAGFEVVVAPTEFIGSVQATDVSFGPDSALYVSEWGEGWEASGRGRIFRFEHEGERDEQATQIAEVKALLGEGFAQRSSDELVTLLAHPDQRVRLRAQWALAAKPDAFVKLAAVAKNGVEGKAKALSRLHGIWGLAHAQRLSGKSGVDLGLEALNKDSDPEVRAQAVWLTGETVFPAAPSNLIEALSDESPRVRFFAAQSLAHMADPHFAEPIIKMLRENNDQDQYLRQAGVNALASCKPVEALAAMAKDSSRAVRMAALLVMRRLGMREISQFLTDNDRDILKEAVRAINDVPIVAAYNDLAGLIEKPTADAQLMIRVLNANFRSGAEESAKALAHFAADSHQPEVLRAEALTLLGQWAKPFQRDRVTGLYRPLAGRDGKFATDALAEVLPSLLESKGKDAVEVSLAAISAVIKSGATQTAPALFDLITNTSALAKVRARALDALTEFGHPKLAEAAQLAMTDDDAVLRVAARAAMGKLDPDRAAVQLAASFSKADVIEQKGILVALKDNPSPKSEAAIAALVSEMGSGKIAPDVQVELLEAAEKHKAAPITSAIETWESRLPENEPLAAYAMCLNGGDKAEGQRIFKEHAIAQCYRCHKVNGSGGEAGPDLSGVGNRHDRRYILESILYPNNKIAEGFQTVILTLKDSSIQVGTVKSETDSEVTLVTPIPGAPPVTVPKAEIKTRENAPSGMPPGFDRTLTRRELRDLVEYVANLKSS